MKRFVVIAILVFFYHQVFAQDSTDIFLNDGKKLYEQEDYVGAMKAFSKGYLISLNNYDVIMGLANSRHKLDLFKPAISLYDKAEEIRDDDPELFFSRGAAYVFINEFKKAIKDFNDCIELDPMHDRVYYYLGFSNAQLSRYKTAIENYTEEIKRNPDNAAAYYNRGAAKAELNNYEAGMDDFKVALEKEPELENGLFNIALSKLGMKQYEEAIKDLNQVILSDNKNLSRAFFYRAEAKYELKRKEEACEDWQKAANLGHEQALENASVFCGSNRGATKKRDIEIIF